MVICFLLVLAAAATHVTGPEGEIAGVAVNGTAGDVPLAGAEVVLRASQNGAFVPVAQTTTDSEGRFRFANLPTDPDVIYLPGVNLGGIHYPGPRMRLVPGQFTPLVKLTAYETVESPSPLVSRRHEIDVQPGEGFLEIAESLVIDNPSRTTFVGYSQNDRAPVTLRLSLPEGIEKVTFDREFHGRNFQLQEGRLTTDLPWPPGSRKLKYFYRVPVEKRSSVLARVLDQPTEHVVVRVTDKNSGPVACNLPRISPPAGQEPVFEHRASPLPAGYEIQLRLGAIPLRLETYARWLAVALLAALVAGSVFAVRARRTATTAKSGAVPPAAIRPAGGHGRRSRDRRSATSSLPSQ